MNSYVAVYHRPRWKHSHEAREHCHRSRGSHHRGSGRHRPLRADVASWLWSSLLRGHEPVERALGRLQGRRRDMGVDGRLAQAAMPKEDLDRPKIGSGLKQVRGECSGDLPKCLAKVATRST